MLDFEVMKVEVDPDSNKAKLALKEVELDPDRNEV